MINYAAAHSLSVDEVIAEAISRERQMKDYYKQALDDVGPDARELLSDLSVQHDERIKQLNRLLAEIIELRELSASIAD